MHLLMGEFALSLSSMKIVNVPHKTVGHFIFTTPNEKIVSRPPPASLSIITQLSPLLYNYSALCCLLIVMIPILKLKI